MSRPAAAAPSLVAVGLYFLRLGLVGFGGPAALADRMRRDLVDERRWLAPAEFDLGLTIAAACPGPLAYQLGAYCGYVRHGVRGAFLVGVAFAAAPFVLVVGLASAYGAWQANPLARGLFHGAAPVIVVVITRACWSLGRRTLHRARLAWAIAAVSGAVTWHLGREPFLLFVAAAALGAWQLRPAGAARAAPDRSRPPTGGRAALSLLASPGFDAGVISQLFAFFFKTGCLVFGSGLVIVPVLRAGVVEAHGWLGEQAFLDSVTVGLVSPGPVVITATFVGFLVGRLPGAAAATAGMFLPAILFTVVAAPWFERHRHHPTLTGAVRGITAAVVGVLAGTVPLVAAGAVTDALAGGILAAAALLACTRRVPDPALMALGAGTGLGAGWLASS